MDLCTLSIVFVLASKRLTFKSIKHLCDGLRWFSQHGLEGYTWLELAVVLQVHNSVLQHRWDDDIVAWKVTVQMISIWLNDKKWDITCTLPSE
jgi:hypothetical protein